jgi:CheY-like chemotaxis protein
MTVIGRRATMARILVAASNGKTRQAISHALTEAGHSLDVVASDVDALARVASASLEVAVVDLAMPGMSGIDLLRALRSASPPMKVVAYVGRDRDISTNTMLLAAKAFGADCILYQPFSRDEILAAVENLCA